MLRTLGHRLAVTLKEKGKTQKELATHCGVSRAAVSQWCDETTKDLKMANLFQASKFLNVNPEWLATGKGDKHQGFEIINDPQFNKVPWINEESINDFMAGTYETARFLPTCETLSQNAFASSIVDTKSQEVNSRQTLVIDPDYTPSHGARVALISAQGALMVRDILTDGPSVFFAGGHKVWAESEVFFIGGVAAVAEQSKRLAK